MSKSKEQKTGIRWDVIFQRRPDLAPPGYHETIAQLYPKKENHEESEA